MVVVEVKIGLIRKKRWKGWRLQSTCGRWRKESCIIFAARSLQHGGCPGRSHKGRRASLHGAGEIPQVLRSYCKFPELTSTRLTDVCLSRLFDLLLLVWVDFLAFVSLSDFLISSLAFRGDFQFFGWLLCLRSMLLESSVYVPKVKR